MSKGGTGKERSDLSSGNRLMSHEFRVGRRVGDEEGRKGVENELEK